MSRKMFLALLLPLIGLALSGCGKIGAEKNGQTPVAAKPPTAVDTVAVQPAEVTDGIEVVGALAPKFQAEVKSEYAGIAAEVYVTEWVRVHKGQPLAKLDTREADVMLQKAQVAVETTKAALLQAEVGLNRADREYERAVKLKESGLATRQNLDDALSAKEAAAAQVTVAKSQIKAMEEEVRHAQTRLAKAVIYSPINGIVAMRGANVGDLVGEMGSPKLMFLIVDNRLLNLTVTVPSNEMERLRLGQPLVFTTDALPGKQFTGKVMFINPSLNPADRSVNVVAEVNNVPEELKGGLFVKGKIVTGKRSGVLLLPREALLSWDVAGHSADVFTIEGNVAHQRRIHIGLASTATVEVTQGLAPGERVVVRGGFILKDGDSIVVKEAPGE